MPEISRNEDQRSADWTRMWKQRPFYIYTCLPAKANGFMVLEDCENQQLFTTIIYQYFRFKVHFHDKTVN